MLAGKTLTIDLSFVLLCVAVVLFALSATRFGKAWMVPVGLACFAGAFVANRAL